MSEIYKLEKLMSEGKPLFCSKCHGNLVFEGGGSYSCSQCGNIELDNFGKVKKYLDENGLTSMLVLEEETGVERKIIEQMLKEGRLEIPESSEYYIQCERCGCDIRYGRFCPDCVKTLAGGIKSVFSADIGEKPKTGGKSSGKMHFLSREKM